MIVNTKVGKSDVRLYQGDCLEFLKTLDADSVDAVIADPPYGARRPSARRKADERFSEIQGNDEVDTRWISEASRVLTEGGAAYVFTCWDRLEQWRHEIQETGLRVRSCVVWDKVAHGLGDPETCWAPQHELILFAAKGRHVLRGSRPQDVIRVNRVPASQLVHPYQKPVRLLNAICGASCTEGQTILDPYVGSGATGIAAVKAGCNFIGCEIDPSYFAIAERRIKEAGMPLFDAILGEAS